MSGGGSGGALVLGADGAAGGAKDDASAADGELWTGVSLLCSRALDCWQRSERWQLRRRRAAQRTLDARLAFTLTCWPSSRESAGLRTIQSSALQALKNFKCDAVIAADGKRPEVDL